MSIIAQSFKLENTETTSGAFLTKLDLFFSAKDETFPVIVEIRELDPSNKLVTNNMVPLGRTQVAATNINTSSDGSVATTFTFETPVFLQNGYAYAIVIIPGGSNPNTRVFTSRLGENDLISSNRIVKNPSIGALYISPNDRDYSIIAEEDLKFALYFANFGTQQTAIITFRNKDLEFFTIDEKTGSSLNRVEEPIHGETTLTLAADIGGNPGDTLVDTTTSANGTITFKSGTTYRVKSVTLANKFNDTDAITLYQSGVATASTTTVSGTPSTPTGKILFFDDVTQSYTQLHISDSTGDFVANTFLKGQFSGGEARIASIDDLGVDTFKLFFSKYQLEETTFTSTVQLALSQAALDSPVNTVINDDNDDLKTRRFVLSKSNESTIGKSATISVTMNNGLLKRHSPAIDLDRTSLITIENVINNESTNETLAEGGGAAQAKYIQRTITLADGQDAEDLRVLLGAYKPASADIQVYVKLLNAEDGETIDDKPWLQLTQETSTTIVSDSEDINDFEEFEYGIPTSSLTGPEGQVQYTSGSVTYTGFKRFKIKIVLLSSNPANPPRVKDFRAIALQI